MKHNKTMQRDLSAFKMLAIIIATGLLVGVMASQTAYADDAKEKKVKDVKKDYKDKKKETKSLKKTTTDKSSIAKQPTSTQKQTTDPMQEKINACKKKETQREQYECEKALKSGSTNEEFKSKSTKTIIGPVTFYYAGATVEKSGGKDIVNLRFLVENTGSKDNIALYCTGPAVCNYDISDGTTTFKYAAQDFTNGQIVLKPGTSRIFNMLFGPAIGYGSYVDFKYDPSKQYTFNVREPWGSGSIPLNLK